MFLHPLPSGTLGGTRVVGGASFTSKAFAEVTAAVRGRAAAARLALRLVVGAANEEARTDIWLLGRAGGLACRGSKTANDVQNCKRRAGDARR
jgi:hypothetical protein